MKEIIIWIVIWYFIWGLYNLYYRWSWEKLGTSKYIPRGLFFLMATLFIYFFYNEIVVKFVTPLIIGFLLSNLIGLFLSVFKSYYKRFPKDKFFILFQSFCILYQQVSVVVAFVLLKNLVSDYKDIYFGLFFGLTHILLIFLPWAKLKFYIFAGCFLAGWIFSYLINNYSYGLILSFLIHYIYYVWEMYYLRDEEKI